MVQIIEAIDENGVLRPVQPLSGINEHTRVKITVEVERAEPHPPAECVGILPDPDAQEIRQIAEDEFDKVNPNEW